LIAADMGILCNNPDQGDQFQAGTISKVGLLAEQMTQKAQELSAFQFAND